MPLASIRKLDAQAVDVFLSFVGQGRGDTDQKEKTRVGHAGFRMLFEHLVKLPES